MKNKGFTQELFFAELEKLRAENARLTRWMFLSVRERLAEHLQSISSVQPSGRAVIIRPPTQQGIADAIGAKRESVSREMAKFERDGLIIRVGQGLGRKSITLMPKLLALVEQAGAGRGLP